MLRKSLVDRMWEHTITIPFSGCWVWEGTTTGKGYGRVRVGGRNGRLIMVHRASHEIFVGPIPEDYEIDHKCRVRSCWNPHHLEAVTHQINVLRGDGPGKLARRTHCSRGHEFSGDNLIIRSNNARRCRICRDMVFERNQKKYNANRRAKYAIARGI